MFFDIFGGEYFPEGTTRSKAPSHVCWRADDNVFIAVADMKCSIHMDDNYRERFCQFLEAGACSPEYMEMELEKADDALVALEEADYAGCRNLCIIDSRLYLTLVIPTWNLVPFAKFLRENK